MSRVEVRGHELVLPWMIVLLAVGACDRKPKPGPIRRSSDTASLDAGAAAPSPSAHASAVSAAMLTAADAVYVSSIPRPTDRFSHMSDHHASRCALAESGDVWCEERGGWSAIGWKPGGKVKRLVASDRGVCALLAEGRIECSEKTGLPARGYRDVAMGEEILCAVGVSGAVVCDGQGELARPPAGMRFREVGCGSVCCALDDVGRPHCWGPGARIAPAKGLSGIAVAGTAACALDGSGSAICWGEFNPRGHQGSFESIELGTSSACGLGRDGRATCWELNVDEQTAVPPMQIAQLTLGHDSGCLIDVHGGLRCWGVDSFGPVPSGRFRTLSGGAGTVCGLREDGRAVCWGFDGSKQAGIPDEPLVDLSVGTAQACGVRVNGALVCWGSDFENALRHPRTGKFTRVAAGNLACALDDARHAHCWGGQGERLQGEIEALAAGSAFTCGLREDGSVTCALGDKFFADRTDATPPEGKRLKSLASGYEHLCGLDEHGSAFCWGRDVAGETSPPAGVAFTRLALGEKRSCGLTVEGKPVCWGGNPKPPPQGAFTDIAMTENTDLVDPAYVCAIRKDDASVVCWSY